jgi:hypothetical protein
MKTIRLLPILALTALASGCGLINEIENDTRVLLEIEYINNAQEPTYRGFLIEGSGDIFRYDREGAAFAFQDSSELEPGDLEGKFAPVKALIVTRPPEEITPLLTLIEVAATGDYSEPKLACADTGTLTYRAYEFDTIKGRYIPVVLRIEGDFAVENTSQAAQELIAYIRSLDLMDEIAGCDP